MNDPDRRIHSLPVVRIQQAYDAARELAREHAVEARVAVQIVQRVIEILEEGTTRWGFLCRECGAALEESERGLACPTHGALLLGGHATMLVAFGPVELAQESEWARAKAGELMAAAIDIACHRGLIDQRSILADARLCYGDPLSAEEAEQIITQGLRTFRG